MEKENRKLERAKPESSRDVEDDISILKQLIDSLDESEKKLEGAYKKNDAETLNKVKKFMEDALNKISEVIK